MAIEASGVGRCVGVQLDRQDALKARTEELDLTSPGTKEATRFPRSWGTMDKYRSIIATINHGDRDARLAVRMSGSMPR